MEESFILSSQLFYSALNDDINDTTIDEKDTCLITHEPLTEHFQTLSCGHSFNYLPLYKYILHSKIPNGYGYIMPATSFKCPYCRHTQYKLIPYIPMDGVVKTYGVNSLKIYTTGYMCCMYNSTNNKKCYNTLIRQMSPGEYYCKKHFKIKCLEHVEKDNSIPVNVILPIPTVTKCNYIFVKGINKNMPCNVSLHGEQIALGKCKKHTKNYVSIITP